MEPEWEASLNANRVGGKQLKTTFFTFNETVHFNSSVFLTAMRFI